MWQITIARGTIFWVVLLTAENRDFNSRKGNKFGANIANIWHQNIESYGQSSICFILTWGFFQSSINVFLKKPRYFDFDT